MNLEILAKKTPSRNGKITLPFTDVGKSSFSPELFMSKIRLLTLFAKIKFSRFFKI